MGLVFGETHRLVIRLLDEEQDASFISKLITSKSWLAGIGDRGSDGAAYIRANNQKDNKLFALELKETKVLVGLCGLLQRDYLIHRDIGYALDSDYEGKGLASEAVTFFLANKLRLDETAVAATVRPENAKSIRLLQRHGFEHKGKCETADGVELYLKTIK